MRTAASNSRIPRRRKRLRAPWWDYQGPGAYFVTVCTWRRKRLLSVIVKERVVLSDAGRIVEDVWRSIPFHNVGVSIDAFVVMPDHVHGIVVIHESGTMLGDVVGRFKAASTRDINRARGRRDECIWQRSYYERIIRDRREWDATVRYIVMNPLRWRG